MGEPRTSALVCAVVYGAGALEEVAAAFFFCALELILPSLGGGLRASLEEFMAAVSCRPSWPVRVGFDRRACAPASRGYSSVAGEASASTMLGFSSSLPSLCYDGASSANGRREELMYRFVAWFSPLWVAALLCGGRRLLRCLPLGCWWVDRSIFPVD